MRTGISIIIPTINARPDLLDECIAACRDTTPDAELLIMDGGTFAENCNQGALLAQHRTLIFLNDDTIPKLHWAYRLDTALDDNAIAGARLLYPDGRIQHTGIYFDMDPGGLVAHNRTWDVPSGPVDAVTGACLAIHHDTFESLNGFDTDFRNGYEDVDLCLRARQQGLPIWYCAEATVMHHESASGAARWTHVADNIRLLQSRWIVTAADDSDIPT